MKKPKAKLLVISAPCIIRGYVYRVHLNPSTLNVVKVTAGCKTWSSIIDARGHYNQYSGAQHYRFDYMKGVDTSRFAARAEALALLSVLDAKVERLQEKRRKAVAATRKAKRLAKKKGK